MNAVSILVCDTLAVSGQIYMAGYLDRLWEIDEAQGIVYSWIFGSLHWDPAGDRSWDGCKNVRWLSRGSWSLSRRVKILTECDAPPPGGGRDTETGKYYQVTRWEWWGETNWHIDHERLRELRWCLHQHLGGSENTNHVSSRLRAYTCMSL